MIGRGTRLSKDLFGPGRDKTKFLIFDHWGNFDYFDQQHTEAQPSQPKSLLQHLFEARIDFADAALQQADLESFAIARQTIAEQINALDSDSISVRERWREIQTASHPDALDQWSTATVELLRRDIAPLMQWIPVPGFSDAYDFDLLLTRTQTELVRGSMRVLDLQGTLIDRLSQLQMNINDVRERFAAIQQAKSAGFWQSVTTPSLEALRKDLRGIMHHRRPNPKLSHRISDIAEDPNAITIGTHRGVSDINQMAIYKERVLSTLQNLFTHDPTLQKIRRAEPVTHSDLDALVSLVLTQNPNADLRTLQEFYPDTAGHLDHLIRTLTGMDRQAVEARFRQFVVRYTLTATQTQFLAMLKQEIAEHGSIRIEQLYDPPFTAVHSDGIEGVFQREDQIEDLLTVVRTFLPQPIT